MGNLLVAGCSVSDYTQVDKVWGEYLAEKLNLNYIHQAAGCGSNWRMWRVVVNAVKNKLISPNDLVFMQYTELTRREFWSPYNNDRVKLYKSNKSWITDQYGDNDGSIIRYKIDADKWHQEPKDNTLFKAYTKHVNPAFEKELFFQQHSMFECFMKQNGFDNVYFLNVGHYCPEFLEEHVALFYKDNFAAIDDALATPNHLSDDTYHMNDTGHTNLANQLVKIFGLDR